MEDEDGSPFFADPRSALGRVCERLAGDDLAVTVAVELEFHLHQGDTAASASPLPSSLGGAVQSYAAVRMDERSAFVEDVHAACEAMGVRTGTTVAESGEGHYEINLHHRDDALRAVADALIFEHAVRNVARDHGCRATFMAKPWTDRPGSGMHVHASALGRDGSALFASEPEVNDALRHAVGGLCATMAEATALLAPNANSFRRFVPGAFVANTASWGRNNRTAAVRIPPGAPRVEHRVAGADANPYLVVAVVLAGLHHGLGAKLDAPNENPRRRDDSLPSRAARDLGAGARRGRRGEDPAGVSGRALLGSLPAGEEDRTRAIRATGHASRARALPRGALMSALNISLDAPGKHVGRLSLPHSRESSAWGSVLVPIVSIRGTSDGPCVLLTGGSHGDEPEGPIALGELAKSLEASEVRGQVIIVPELNAPAVAASTRLSPLDGKNMNRVFPGDPRGTVTERIAHFIHAECVSRATAVVDIHSGGRSLEFVPTTLVHAFDDEVRTKETLALARAFGAPHALVVSELDDQGMLDTEVERAGKLFLSTELGGGGRVTPRTASLASAGARNVLRHLGALEGEPAASAETRVLRVPDEGFVIATDDGLFEPTVSLGENVTHGQVVGCVHRRAGSMREPVAHRAPLDGVFVGQRALAATERGDCLGLVAVPHD